MSSMNELQTQECEFPPLLLSGLDSLYVGYGFDLSTGGIDFEELEFRKLQTKVEHGEKFAEIVLGSERFALMPFGRYPYRYILRNDLFEISLAEQMYPSCRVQFYSKGLWHFGLEGMTNRIDVWRRSLDLVESRPDAVSRVDWSFDFHLTSVDMSIDHFVTRAAKDATYRQHGMAQTFTFGRGDVVIRIYDKTAEIEQQSGKSWFFELWNRKDQVWRIEFQVRRDRLKSAGIETIENLKDLQNDLLRELASSHTTLRCPNEDSNRSRWPLHPLWQSLLKAIGELPQTGLVRSMNPKQDIRWRIEKQVEALYGSLKGYAAAEQLYAGDVAVMELPDLMGKLERRLRRRHQPDIWREDVMKRVTAHGLGQW